MSSVYRWYTQHVRGRFVYDSYKTMEATLSRHGWVHMFIRPTHRPTVTLQLHNFDFFRTCRTSSFCTDAWQLARFQLRRRIARSLGDSWASCSYSNSHATVLVGHSTVRIRRTNGGWYINFGPVNSNRPFVQLTGARAPCNSLLHAVRILRSQSKYVRLLHDVFRPTVVAKLTYFAPSWSGACSAADCAKLDSLISWAYCLEH